MNQLPHRNRRPNCRPRRFVVGNDIEYSGKFQQWVWFPTPLTGKAEVNLPMAKHFIDTLGVLDEKTSGNLEDDEKQLLNESLHQLRMAFVMAGKAASGGSESEQTDAAGPSIELP